MTTKSNFGNTLERICNKDKEDVQELTSWEMQTFHQKLPKLNIKPPVNSPISAFPSLPSLDLKEPQKAYFSDGHNEHDSRTPPYHIEKPQKPHICINKRDGGME